MWFLGPDTDKVDKFCFVSFLFKYSCFTMLLVSAIQQSDPLCHHRALGRISCAIQ